MPYKITYFNARGRAEVSRMLLCLADQEFEDVRVDSEQWMAMKEGQCHRHELNPAMLSFHDVQPLNYKSRQLEKLNEP